MHTNHQIDISLTSDATGELSRLLAEKSGDEEFGLRLEVEQGGCAGYQYIMKIAPLEEGDLVLGEPGAQVFMPPASASFLQGCVINYENSLNDAGFRVENPNASRSCGCGTSFEPAPAEATADPAQIPSPSSPNQTTPPTPTQIPTAP